MKKLLFALLLVAVASQAIGQITVKQVLGDWKYSVNIDQGTLTGVIKVIEKEGKLAGTIIDDGGNSFPAAKMEIREGNILYFELTPDYDLLKVTLKIDGKKFTGTVGTPQGEVPITGEKKE